MKLINKKFGTSDSSKTGGQRVFICSSKKNDTRNQTVQKYHYYQHRRAKNLTRLFMLKFKKQALSGSIVQIHVNIVN